MKVNVKLINRIILVLIVVAILAMGGLLVHGASMFMGGK
jgi:hypothetical protein